jgi:hypothetical protein
MALGGSATMAACSLSLLDGLSGGRPRPPDVDAPDTLASFTDADDDGGAVADARDAEDIDAAGGCYVAEGATPAIPDVADSFAHELGTRVRPTRAVVAKKMRFWKAPSEPSADRVGTIWTTNGTVVATATLAAGPASGWIEGAFTAPVALESGQDYVVSVSVSSHYAATNYYFATTDFVCPNGKLVAPTDTTTAPNGLFGASRALPKQTYRSSFYFVDLYVE